MYEHNDSMTDMEREIRIAVNEAAIHHLTHKRTNAEHIRYMNDEELAKLLCCTGWRMTEHKECLEWLQQPAERTAIHDLNPCPCKDCIVRGRFAIGLDMHFWGDDCPYKCDAYKTWNRETGEWKGGADNDI